MDRLGKSQKNFDVEGQSALTIQNQMRKRMMANRKMHRVNLAERLLFESKVLVESARFVNQVLIFALLLAALRLSSKEVSKRSIYDNLNGEFDFETLEGYTDRQAFVEEGLSSIAEVSKSYFLRSSQYFDDGGYGGTLILRDATKFTGPKFSGALAFNGAEFSFTAWVKTSSSFIRGHIVRKGLNTGKGSDDLSCWSWYLHSTFGQQLHFAGHDYFPTPDEFPASSSSKRQEEFSPTREAFEAGQWAFLTLTVSSTTATFYHNLREIGSVTLPKPLSDCPSADGIQVGAADLELGAVQYHRTALSLPQIEELTSAGASLADISTGSGPAEFSTTDLEVLGGSVNSNFAEQDAKNVDLSLRTEASFVMQDARPTDPSTYQSAPAKVGQVVVNTTELSDGTRSYVQLAMGPELLTETFAEVDHRYLKQWPSFRGTGMSLTMWYRHFNRQCIDPTDPCGLYLLDARDGADACWGLWIQSNPLRFWVNTPLNVESGFLDNVPGVAEKYTFLSEKVWRHISLVLDETDNTAKVYLDGTLVAQREFKSVDQADCSSPDKALAYGHAYPGYTYGAAVSVADLRMYNHGTGGPLTPAEISTLAGDATAKAALGGNEYLCLTIDNPMMEEKLWADRYGHTCTWYAEQAEAFPGICNHPGAADNCPSACSSKQECWLNAKASKAYYTWDGIKRVDPGENARNGAVCLSDALDPATVVAECESWVASGAAATTDTFALWASSYEDAQGRRLDLRQCSDLAEAILEGCAFDSEAVKQFTADSQANNGDFSVAFWIKPLGQNSLTEGGRFIPHIQFLSSMSPPTHHMGFGFWENPNGEVRLYSDCEASLENIEIKAASVSDWTFIAITKKNKRGTVRGEATVVTNSGTNFEGSAWEDPQCLFDTEHFFKALEVNYPSMISPIMMVPEAVPVALLQQQYLRDKPFMAVKSGPLGIASELEAIEIDKDDFGKPSVLVAPPIIFQRRSAPASECAISFAKQFITDQHSKMTTEQCRPPYDCDAELLQDPSQLLSCPGDDMVAETQFGLDPVDFNNIGYADFLFTITDSLFLSREGVIFKASNFIDSMTTEAKIMLVFFTPQAGTTTVLTIDADFETSAAIAVQVQVGHFEIVEDNDLTAYMTIQILIFLPIVLMTIDVFFHFKKTVQGVIAQKKHDMETSKQSNPRRSGLGASPKDGCAAIGMAFKLVVGLITEVFSTFRSLFVDLVDLVMAALVITYVVLKIPAVNDSAKDADRVVGKLGNIDWTSRDLSLSEKTKLFLESISEINDLLNWETNLNRLCTFVLLLSLLRLLKCTSMHPRLALLEGTIIKAWDDLWHSAILILLLMTCFAGIATWSFGSERPDFGNFEASLQKLFEMTFGEFPDDWTESFEMRLFTVLYFMIVFLLVQNFLLAVIVEAYMGVRADNNDLQTEQEFIMDIYTSAHSHYLAARKGWPMPHKLGAELEHWTARRSVGYKDLCATGMFRNKAAVTEFVNWYRGYDFLEPEPFDEYGPVIKNEQERMVHELELRLAKQQGVHVPTLKEFAAENIKIATDRKGKRRPKAQNGNGNAVYQQAGMSNTTMTRSRNLVRDGSQSASSDVAFFLPPHQNTSVQPSYSSEIGYSMPGMNGMGGMGGMNGMNGMGYQPMGGMWGGGY